MISSFINARIVTPDGIVAGTLTCDGATITDIHAGSAPAGLSGDIVDVDNDYLLPGFIDTQVKTSFIGGLAMLPDMSGDADQPYSPA
ncbi:hypothetical protein [Novosphingobium terrae]|uniref:hypothetical protein n=1 Tax=Novosphingobium terrae TaxID=2726189 RepID=UPI00197E3759|nr:hypothetical protein [Novosphingobium terrae]